MVGPTQSNRFKSEHDLRITPVHEQKSSVFGRLNEKISNLFESISESESNEVPLRQKVITSQLKYDNDTIAGRRKWMEKTINEMNAENIQVYDLTQDATFEDIFKNNLYPEKHLEIIVAHHEAAGFTPSGMRRFIEPLMITYYNIKLETKDDEERANGIKLFLEKKELILNELDRRLDGNPDNLTMNQLQDTDTTRAQLKRRMK